MGEGLDLLLVLCEPPGVKPKMEPKVKKYLFASTMGDMRPLTRVWPLAEVDADWAAYDAAFAKVYLFLEVAILWRK